MLKAGAPLTPQVRVSRTGRQMTLDSAETWSRLVRNIDFSRMSRIITMDSFISDRPRGAGGAMTVVVCMFIVNRSATALTHVGTGRRTGVRATVPGGQ